MLFFDLNYMRYVILFYRCAFIFLLLMSCSAPAVVCVSSPSVVAHRGGASLGPENTLLCIERAIEVGVDAVEVDVRLTADGHAVLMHDAGVERTTNGKGLVASMTIDEVLALRIVDKGVITDDRVPLLSEALSLVAGRCGVLIEVKDDDARGVEAVVLSVVQECGAEGWVAVQSFSDSVLERFCSLGVSFPLEKLFVFKVPFLPIIYDGSFSRFSFDKYEYISSFNIHKWFACKKVVGRLRSAGKAVKVWTLGKGDSKLPANIDGLITDYPQSWLP